MNLVTRNEFQSLTQVHQPYCVSIFIPTHRAGKEVYAKKDVIALRNQLKKVKTELEAQDCPPREIEKILEPAEALISERDFWGNQSDGLALFMADGIFSQHTLPIHFETYHYVSREFYLKPLLPLFHGDGRFYLLALSLKEPALYECTRHSITPITISDLVPSRIEEIVGYDYEPDNLQFRSQQAGFRNQQGGLGQAAFHGHGEGKDDRKNEIKRYIRAIDKGLMTMFHDIKDPLVIASVDYLYPIYKDVTSYSFVFPEYVHANPEKTDLMLLHEKAWEIVSPKFDQERQEKKALFDQFFTSNRTASDIRKILPAALEGKVDALFIENRSDIWGIYDPASDTVRLQEHDEPANVSLLNLAAIEVFLKGGRVYLQEPEEMPDPASKINALFYY